VDLSLTIGPKDCAAPLGSGLGLRVTWPALVGEDAGENDCERGELLRTSLELGVMRVRGLYVEGRLDVSSP